MAVLYDLRGGKANDPRFGSRMHGLGHYADLIRQRFALACRRLGLTSEWPALDCSAFSRHRRNGFRPGANCRCSEVFPAPAPAARLNQVRQPAGRLPAAGRFKARRRGNWRGRRFLRS